MSDIHAVIICGQHAEEDTFLCMDLINYFAFLFLTIIESRNFKRKNDDR